MFLCAGTQVLGQLLFFTVEQVDSRCIDTFSLLLQHYFLHGFGAVNAGRSGERA